MRTSTKLLLSALALFQTALAIPPACLLGALNTEQQNLADISTICSKSASDVQANISKLCGAMTDDALSYFADTCKQVASVSVASPTSSSPSATGTHSSTDVLDNPTPTANSASGSARSTGGAPAATQAAGSLAAMAVAAAGILVAV